ncbi:unnamed protein product, partial [Effrenium voratum]
GSGREEPLRRREGKEPLQRGPGGGCLQPPRPEVEQDLPGGLELGGARAKAADRRRGGWSVPAGAVRTALGGRGAAEQGTAPGLLVPGGRSARLLAAERRAGGSQSR